MLIIQNDFLFAPMYLVLDWIFFQVIECLSRAQTGLIKCTYRILKAHMQKCATIIFMVCSLYGGFTSMTEVRLKCKI